MDALPISPVHSASAVLNFASDPFREPHLTPLSPDRFVRALPIALLPALFGLLLVCLIPMERAALALGYPYQMDREEGYILGDAMAMNRGESIYQPIIEPPFIVGNYGPVYPALMAPLLSLTGPSLLPGRLIVLLSAIVILAALAMLVIRARQFIMPAALAVVLFASSWDVSEWLPFVRVDFTAMAFGLGGMVALVWMKRGGWAVAGLCFALSVLTKQTMLAAPMAALIGLLWCGRWRDGILMTAAALVPWTCVTVAFQISTGGEYLRHTVVYNANVFHWGDLLTWLKHLMKFNLWKMFAAAVAIVVLLLAYLFPSQREGDKPTEASSRLAIPMCVSYLILSAISALGIAKVGSAPNYLLELQAGFSLVIALALGEILAGLRHAWTTKTGGVAVVALVSLHWIAIALWPAETFEDGTSIAKTGFYNRTPGEQALELATRVRMRVADAPAAPVLCEEPIFQILERRPLWFEPFIMTQLAKEGHWDETPFVEMLRNGHFALLILNQDIRNEDQYFPAFSPAMRAAIREAYDFERVIGGRYWVFVPKREEVVPETDGVIVNESMDTQKRWDRRHWDFAPLPMPEIAERHDPDCRVIG
jgi:hypothetical protein